MKIRTDSWLLDWSSSKNIKKENILDMNDTSKHWTIWLSHKFNLEKKQVNKRLPWMSLCENLTIKLINPNKVCSTKGHLRRLTVEHALIIHSLFPNHSPNKYNPLPKNGLASFPASFSLIFSHLSYMHIFKCIPVFLILFLDHRYPSSNEKRKDLVSGNQ